MTGQWTSWAKANAPGMIAVWGDKVYAGGEGGVTVWSRSTGSLSERYTTSNGLPGSWVSALLVDEQNNTLWVGTDNGLARYDGQNWKVYGREEGLDSATIMALTLTKSGLLIGTYYSDVDGGGLNRLTAAGIQAVPNFPRLRPTRSPINSPGL